VKCEINPWEAIIFVASFGITFMCKSMRWNGKTTLMLWIYTVMWWFSLRIRDTFQISNMRVENKISSVIDYLCCCCCCSFAWKLDLVFNNKPYFLIKSYVQYHWRFHPLKPMGVKTLAQYSIQFDLSYGLKLQYINHYSSFVAESRGSSAPVVSPWW